MKYYLFNNARKQQIFLLIGDVVILLLAIGISYSIRIYINNDWQFSWNLLFAKLTLWLLPVVMPHLFSLYLLGLYDLNNLIYRVRSSVYAVLSVLLAGLLIGSIFFFVPRYVFGRQVLLIHLMVASLLLVSWRLLFREIAVRLDRPQQMAVIGSYGTVVEYSREVEEITDGKIVLSAACVMGKSRENTMMRQDVLLFDSVDELLEWADFDILVFSSLEQTFIPQDIQGIIEEKYYGKTVFDLPSFYTNLTGKIPLRYIDGNWLLQREGIQGYISRPYVYMKRLLDLILALLLLILFAPTGLVIAIIIKLDSQGPVIFSQERIGKYKKPFNCLKFRTMVADAEQESGPVWSGRHDPRITRVGRFLRRTRLDELPQLLNILKGELSFVGPRPIRRHFAEQLRKQIPFYDIRFSVQPGLSGWAQTHNKYAVPDGEGALEYELFYILNMSLVLDILTMVKTIRAVFRSEGR